MFMRLFFVWRKGSEKIGPHPFKIFYIEDSTPLSMWRGRRRLRQLEFRWVRYNMRIDKKYYLRPSLRNAYEGLLRFAPILRT